MAPEMTSILEPVDETSVVETPPPKPMQETATQQRRLEDVRRVRDEAESLRQEICKLRLRLEEVEEESKFHAAKANELTELLTNSNSGGSDELVLQQASAMAKRACQIEKLEKTITNLTTEKALLEIERDKAKKETADLSGVVRSLQSVTTLSMDKNDDDDDETENDDEDDDEEEIVLTPETALDLTLGNLKEHIEMLEDGLQASSNLNITQKKKIGTLEKENQLNQVKIGMLEELFRELNVNDRDFYEKRVLENDKNNENTNAADPTANAAKPKTSSSWRKKAKKSKEPAAPPPPPQSDPTPSSAAREHNLKRLGLIERFRKIRTGAFSAPAVVEKQPVIPEEAAAAAQAAKILTTSDQLGTSLHGSKHGMSKSLHGSLHGLTLGLLGGSSHGLSSKSAHGSSSSNRKTTMKKVKIRFKKAGLEGTYTGPLVDKKPHGVGTIRFTNGDTYLGEMTRGKMSGTGTLYTKSRGVFRGQFENNRFVGEKQPQPQQSSSIESDKETEATSVTEKTAESDCNETTETKATPKTTETPKESLEPLTKEQSENAMAALELDGFSPTTITGSDDFMDGIDDMVMGADSMDMGHSDKVDDMVTAAEQEEKDAFLRELEGVDSGDDDNSNKENNSFGGDEESSSEKQQANDIEATLESEDII